jgi:hypothetical protein
MRTQKRKSASRNYAKLPRLKTILTDSLTWPTKYTRFARQVCYRRLKVDQPGDQNVKRSF